MLESFVNNELHTYGPWAVFLLLMLSGIGVPVGEDIITIPAGALVAAGHLAFWPTLLFAYFGVVFADILWFTICYRWGTPILHLRLFKRLIHPRRILQIKHQFEERGIWIVVMARFIPSSRTPTITTAGILHMSPWRFAVATAACVSITAPMQVGIGYLIGRGIGTEDTATLLLRLMGLIAALVVASLVLNWWIRSRSGRSRPPRAKARWLRRRRKTTLRAP